MNKRILAAMACCLAVLSLAGCDRGSGSSGISSTTSSVGSTTASSTESDVSSDEPVISEPPISEIPPAQSQVEGYEYEEREDGVYITKIPDVESIKVISSIGGKPVYGIDVDGQTFDNLKRLVIPAGIQAIGDGSFYKCETLETLEIGDGLKIIGDDAFTSCIKLSEITLPDSVEEIGDESFMDAAVSSFRLPKNIRKLGALAFYGQKIEDIDVGDSINYKEKDGFIMSKDETVLLRRTKGAFGNNKLVGRIEIPDGVVTIGDCAFMNETNISEITIPPSVRDIGRMAFAGCTGIEGVAFPNSLKSIGAMSFSGTGLKEVSLPVLEEIPDSAFMSCKYLSTVTFKDTDIPVRIGAMAFSGCPLVGDIRLPSNTTYIGQSAFEFSNGTIYVPDSVYECYAFGMTLRKNATIDYCGNTYESFGDFLYDVQKRARNTPEDGAVSMASGDITKGDISLLGETYHIGDTLQRFLDDGWMPDDIDKTFDGGLDYLMKDGYKTKPIWLNKHNCSIKAEFANNTDDTVSLAECTLSTVEFTTRASDSGSFDGITAGKSLRSDVVAAFGNPAEAYHPLEMVHSEDDKDTCLSYLHTYEYDASGAVKVEFEFGSDNNMYDMDCDPETPVYRILIQSQ